MAATNPSLDRADVPLCFATGAISGDTAGPKLLFALRERYPNRTRIIPAWVVAEKVRQMRLDKGNARDLDLVRAFLGDRILNLLVPAFSREEALGAWLQVVGSYRNDAWDWKPSRQRCIECLKIAAAEHLRARPQRCWLIAGLCPVFAATGDTAYGAPGSRMECRGPRWSVVVHDGPRASRRLPTSLRLEGI